MSKDEKIVSSSWVLLFFAWLISIIATLGSLFFSEVMEFPPCTLCWYQRIMMYPLVLILFVGLFPLDKTVFRYATPLVVVGFFFAVYHNLLHFKIIPESASPCSQGVACSTKYIDIFGFITIPMLSFVSFSVITILLYIIKNKEEKN